MYFLKINFHFYIYKISCNSITALTYFEKIEIFDCAMLLYINLAVLSKSTFLPPQRPIRSSSVLLKNTMTCGQEQPGIKPPNLQSEISSLQLHLQPPSY